MGLNGAIDQLRTTRVPLIYFLFVCAFALLALSFLPNNGIAIPSISLYQDCNNAPLAPRVVRTVILNYVVMHRSPATPAS